MFSKMSLGKRRYCVFGCADLGAYMHSFPHPEKRTEMFEKWVSIVRNKLKETDPIKIFKNKKVCGFHFTLEQKVASHRLHISAVPSLHLDGIFSTSSVQIQLEHNYCFQGVAMSTPVIQPSTSTVNTFDTGSRSSETLLTSQGTDVFKKSIKNLKCQLRKSKRNLATYKSRLSAMTNTLSDQTALKKVTRNMNTAAKMFTDMQFRHALKKPKGRRYNIDEKVMALSLYKRSPKGYSLFSKYFKLPSAKCLKNLLQGIKIVPGINKIIFDKIKETVADLQEQEKICTLIFDEMSIEPHILYDCTNDKFDGFVSHNNDIKLANHVLVFMVKGVKMSFKQPVAYYFTQSLKTNELKSILKEVIQHVHNTGLRILCTVCDQGATNVSTINSLVADTKARYLKKGKEWRSEMFSIDGRQIIPLYDVPHLLKGLRNNLLEKKFKYIDYQDQNKEKMVDWKYFEMLYEADKTCGELRCLHKLTDEHIYKNKIKKMRVKMAAQVFSHSVAVTADHLTARNMLPQECRQLIPFVLLIDKLFDSLNAGTFHIPNGKIYRGAVRRHSPHHKLWQDALQLLKHAKFVALKKHGNIVRITESSAPSLKNLIKTIQGIQSLWTTLNKQYSFDSMLTRNFNQDPVENFFGNIRSLGVRNISPNCTAFEGAYKTLLLNNYNVTKSINSNCEEDFNNCLQSIKFLLQENKIENNKVNESYVVNQEILDVIADNTRAASDMSMAPKRYVCGWVLAKCLKNIIKNCKICKESLLSKNANENYYIRAKEFNAQKQWLCYPSNVLVESFLEIEHITMMILKTNFQKYKIKQFIKFLIQSFVSLPFICELHKEDLSNYFIETSINMLICSWCRNVNRILSGKITNKDLDDTIKKAAQTYYNTHKYKKM